MNPVFEIYVDFNVPVTFYFIVFVLQYSIPWIKLKFIIFVLQNSIQQCLRKGILRIIIPSRIILTFTHSNILHFSINSINSKPFASPNNTHRMRTRMIQLHIQSTCQCSLRITHELDHTGRINHLILCPCIHDGTIIDTVNDDFIHPRLFFKSVLKLLVGRDLAAGSGGCEGAG
uniref:Uncharacterized protein n=1 Tax=Skeletonema marinoi TaxID=267567 RepID=A0A7S2PLZ1_9STRA